MTRSVIFDTETTSLIENTLIPLPRQPYIVEFYSCLVEGGEVIDELEFLCKHKGTMAPDAFKAHGITPEMLEDALPWADHASSVIKMFRKADEVVAHNLPFDMQMVNNEMARIERLMFWPVKRICTVECTEHILGKRLKMGDLYEYLFGERFADAHRAGPDTRALVRCFNELRARGEL